MAQRKQKDMISRLAGTGEEALQRIGDLPGGARLVEAANALRDRVDELTRRVRSLDPLERRVAELERRLDELASAGGTTGRRARKPRPTSTGRSRSSRAG